MDFGFSPEQEELRKSARAFFKETAPTSYARRVADGCSQEQAGQHEGLWHAMAGLGWTGLLIPEDLGGSGLGLLDLCLLLEEGGRVVLPGPFLSTSSLAVPALMALGSSGQQSDILPAIAAGSRRVSVAVAEKAGRWDAAGLQCQATASDEGFLLVGSKLFVPDAATADQVVVVARLDRGLGFFLVEPDGQGVAVQRLNTVDQTRDLYLFDLKQVSVGREALLGQGADETDGATLLDGLMDRARVALAAEMCGCAAAALDLSLDYVKTREQFGRPVGSFQAIQHKLADMAVLLENSRSLVYYAAWALDHDSEDAGLAAAMAKSYASHACPQVVTDAIQAHGGIGFTWEHDLQLYLKRVKAGESTYGDSAYNNERVAARLL